VVKPLPALFVILLLSGFQLRSQYFSSGQDPASIRWRQIKTDRYKLIYPEPFEKKAQYLANIMEMVCRYETRTLSAKVPRIPVVIHTQSANSNGITAWAPKRIELYPCAPQQTYAEEWLEQLALHEYRHAVQISKLNKGFTKALYFIFGEQATGAVLGLFVPTWFLEGDATVTETALSCTGRGRSSLFESPLRAQLIEKGAYRYDKATLGSYKDYVPDPYFFGYYFVGQARKKYGPELWNAAMDKTARYPFMVVPFNSGIRKVTGLSKVKLYKETMTTLENEWRLQLTSSGVHFPRYLTHRKPKDFSIYTHPLYLNDTTILADKSSMDDIDHFVLIDSRTGHEKILLTPGNYISGTTSIGGDYIVWSEEEPDYRWENESYAEIKMFNLKTGKIRDLTHDTRFFSPIISPDGSLVAAVHTHTDNACDIHVIELATGKTLREYPVPEYSTAITPNWSPDGKLILFTLLNQLGETIAVLDTRTGSIETLMPFEYQEFNGPAYFHNNHVIFSVDYSGTENIYALDTLTHTKYRITSGKFASLDPDFSSDRKRMVYSDYTSDGLMVAEMVIDSTTWVPGIHDPDRSIHLADTLSAQEGVNIQDSVLRRNIWKMNRSNDYDLKRDTIAGRLFESKKYSKIANLFNPHSWAPASLDISTYNFHPGVSVMMQNVLSTTFATAGFQYNINEQTGQFFANLSWQGWYPVFDFRFSIGNRAARARIQGTNETVRYTWQETDFSATVSIPWNFSHGKFYRAFQPSVGINLINVAKTASTPEHFTCGLIPTMNYRIFGYQYLRSSAKDLYPKWGQALEVVFQNAPFAGNSMGSIFGTNLNLYFPGIFRHHGIWIYGGYQQEWGTGETSYDYADIISYPRGYTGVENQQAYTLSFNYKFPFWYPDFAAGSVLYFKRFKLNLFYDWAEGWDTGQLNRYQTIGAELTADLHILRFLYPFELGLRSMFFPTNSTWGFEFMWAVNI
jgi:hypothetical protein